MSYYSKSHCADNSILPQFISTTGIIILGKDRYIWNFTWIIRTSAIIRSQTFRHRASDEIPWWAWLGTSIKYVITWTCNISTVSYNHKVTWSCHHQRRMVLNAFNWIFVHIPSKVFFCEIKISKWSKIIAFNTKETSWNLLLLVT